MAEKDCSFCCPEAVEKWANDCFLHAPDSVFEWPEYLAECFADAPAEVVDYIRDSADSPERGYCFRNVDPWKVYTLDEAANLVGMTYKEAYNAVKVGSIRAVRSAWNSRRLLVKGSELVRVFNEEFVEVDR